MGGLLLAVLAGVLSAGMQLSNAYGHDAVVRTMQAHGVAAVPSEMGFWAAGLFGGALVNVLYPAVLMTRKKSWGVLVRHWPEASLGICMGAQLMLAFALFGFGRMLMGRFGDAQAPAIQLPMQIIGGLAVGFLAGEWRGVGRRPTLQICLAIGVLIVGALLSTYAQSL